MVTLKEELNDYSIDLLITKRQNLAVYKGTQLSTKKDVIIKTHLTDYPTLKDIATLNQEFRILQKMKLRDVAEVYDFIRVKNHHYLVMEYLPGITLKAFLKNNGKLDLNTFFNIAIQIVSILDKIHQQKIIHKDFNSSNVLIIPETLKIYILDFGIASELSFEMASSVSEGTLAYISPEQTGRTSQNIDFRTDFYSLGVTFYEMLAGKLPFQSDDILEMVFYLMTQPPPPIPFIPPLLEKLIFKLMAKNPDERYRSAKGILFDLKKLMANEQPFELGKEDFKSEFLISQKMYGREAQIDAILKGFQSYMALGESEIFLVAAPSGMGKSTLIQEVQKPLISFRGMLIKGKYDILQKSEPYFGIRQAIRHLISQLLAKDNLEEIKKEIKGLVGSTGRALANIVPEIESIIPEMPELESFSPEESKNVLQLTFSNFFRAIAKHDCPLVIYLDDLQWVDQASMDLIEYLLQSTPYLFFLGAFRDNEISDAHPLTLSLSHIPKKTILHLQPLTLQDVENLLRDTFETQNVSELAEQIFLKTSGNPFFVKELLKDLYEQKLIYFKNSEWFFDLEQIRKTEITSNVIDLMCQKLHTLSPDCFHSLSLGACIGSSFDLNTIASISGKENRELASTLWEGVKAGLIYTEGNDYLEAELGKNITYSFSHDKVQEAAYNLVTEDKRVLHLKIARNLYGHGSLYDVVEHYNRGLDLIIDESEKLKVANLNVDVSRKAKASNAYGAALKYIESARLLFPDRKFEVERDYGECLYLNGQFKNADEQLNKLLKQTKNKKERLQVLLLLATQNLNQSNYKNSVEFCIEGLKLVGIYLPQNPSVLHLLKTFLKLQTVLLFTSKEKLKNLPILPKESEEMAAVEFFAVLSPASYSLNPNLNLLGSFATILFAIQYGASAASCYAYGGYMIVLNEFNQFKRASYWNELFFNEAKKLNSSSVYAKVYFLEGCFYCPWHTPLRKSLSFLENAKKYSLETGNFVFLAYSYFISTFHHFLIGQSLDETLKAFDNAIPIVQRGDDDYYQMMSLTHPLLSLLKDEKQILPLERIHSALNSNMNAVGKFYIATVQLGMLFIYERLDEAFKVSKIAIALAEKAVGIAIKPYSLYISILSAVPFFPTLSKSEQKNYLKAFKRVKIWAEQCPSNYKAIYLHLCAEFEALKGRDEKALEFFEKALNSAEEQISHQYSAIISEAIANFYKKYKKNDRLAKVYLQIARYHYDQWGAIAKVKNLEMKNPNTFQSYSLVSEENSLLTTGAHSLDYITLLKSTQILSSEIILEDLLRKLIHLVKENAGAQRVVFIIMQGNELYIEAEGLGKSEVLVERQKVTSESQLPMSLIKLVLHSKKPVILHDASKNAEQFQEDQYFKTNVVRSVLCQPILYQSKVMGILYLENNAAAQMFTEDRIEMLKILTSQAAISLENAQLYKASGRFVPMQFLNALGKRSLVDVKLGDQVPKKMTILVCDIRNFTTTSESLSSEETFAFINRFLGVMEPIITSKRGFIDKYIGDAIMALFSQKADDALGAGIEMFANLPAGVKIGVGLNTGDLILGILGGTGRIDSSVIGDSVNIAFRVEKLTKEMGAFLITDSTKLALKNPDDYLLRPLEEVFVKGKTKAVLIWEVCDIDPPHIKKIKKRDLNEFLTAREAYLSKNFGLATRLFQECLTNNPSDQACIYFLEKMKRINWKEEHHNALP